MKIRINKVQEPIQLGLTPRPQYLEGKKYDTNNPTIKQTSQTKSLHSLLDHVTRQ